MSVIIMAAITIIAIYTLAMMISYAITGHPAPGEEFRIRWWKE